MTMTHDEALAKANYAYCQTPSDRRNADMEAAIRAYLDARGLVMVQREPSERPVSALNAYVCRVSHDECGRRMWRDAIAAHPDPFKDA